MNVQEPNPQGEYQIDHPSDAMVIKPTPDIRPVEVRDYRPLEVMVEPSVQYGSA
ncbi:MAG: hypothetical protein QF486_00805 [Candidatus Woesearchaeota archaeon]|jgi:hypothetical protein|nr:hypothetical protein [Candidatus Woesearchaeota archaeon]MDP7198141.1 hypothetical protein [Candidatus Woesearchaeota archaeon]MDP7466975.1 hypothetical protein [Candidatus Woesearchaeota archaeon]MDP7646939.1 hypothetical protein [Candidatus Woesearchaeota archaeon]